MPSLEPHCLLIPGEISPRYTWVTKDELYVAEVLAHLDVRISLPQQDWELRILTSKISLPFLETPDCVGPKLPPEEIA